MKTAYKLFNSTLKKMKYGLVRLSPDFTLIDKNEMAEAVMVLPQRGSKMSSYFNDTEAILSELKKTGAAVVTVCSACVTRNAVAFAEENGNILILFHPLMSAIYLGKNYGRVQFLLKNYCKNVLNLLKTAENGGISHYGASYFADKPFFDGLDGRDLFTVSNAVDIISEKLSHTVTKKELSVLIDTKCKTTYSCVRFTQIEYVLGELLSMCEYYGVGDSATLRIGCAENCLMLVLIDKAELENGIGDEYYLKIFGEFMRLIDVGTSAHVTAEGELIIKVFLPYANLKRFMQSAYAPLWDCFDYMRAYYGK